MPSHWQSLNHEIIECEKCPRLREHCQTIATVKRAAYRDWQYWAKPVPNLGTANARLLIVGLAPGAHGANRTGRMFTGDKSGDFLYEALHATGFANQPNSTDIDDGLKLIDAVITAPVHCAPPDNKPTTDEKNDCFDYFTRTVSLMPKLRGMVALGRIAFDATMKLYRQNGWLAGRKKPPFGHGLAHEFDAAPFVITAFHPSQQNTFTGRLTQDMMQDVFRTALGLLD